MRAICSIKLTGDCITVNNKSTTGGVSAKMSSIPSVPNEAYAMIDPPVNVQENVAYTSSPPHATRPTGTTATNPAVYETINIEDNAAPNQ